LQKVTEAIDDEFPLLEYMGIAPPTKEDPILTLPGTFRPPSLRHLLCDALTSDGIPVTYGPRGPRHSLACSDAPIHLLVPNRDVEEKLLHASIMMTRVYTS
jgi:hypothetical protein